MNKNMSQRVAMINVPSKMGVRKWAQCFILTSNRAGVFGINETFLKSCKRTYLTLAKVRGIRQFGIHQGPNPIFWKKKYWKFIEAEHVHLHGKGPNYRNFPGFNDDRYMTIVVLQKINKKGEAVGPPQAFLFTHWAAFGGRDKVPNGWVQARQKQCIDYSRDIIELGLDKGMIVWFSGDTNHSGPINFGKRFHWIKGSGIDKVGVGVPKGVKFVKGDFNLYPAPTDHQDGIATSTTLSV